MSITAQEARVVHTANGTATFFSFAPIQGVTSANLKVWLYNPTTGALTAQTLGADYTFGSGGVTFTTAPPNGHRVILRREVPFTQPDVYTTNTPFPAKVTENRLDQIVMGMQELRDDVVNRSLRLPIGDAGFSSNVLPPLEDRKNKLLGFDANGNPQSYGVAAPNFLIPGWSQNWLVNSIDQASGRSNLGFTAVGSAIGTAATAAAARSALGITAVGDSLVTATSAAAARSAIGAAPAGSYVQIGDNLNTANLQYTAPATGAVARALTGRLWDILSVRDFGAVGNGTADDTAAVQAAVNAAIAANGGTVYFPRGSYRVTSTIVVDPSLAPQGSASIALVGEGPFASSLFSNTVNVRVLEFRGALGSLRGMAVYNRTFATDTNAAVVRLFSASNFFMQNCHLEGGFNTLLIDGTNSVDNTFVACSFSLAVGQANVRLLRSSGTVATQRFQSCLFGQSWPVSVPNNANFKGARANNTAYAVGDVVSVTFSGTSYFIQCRIAGTSGSSAPSPPSWYGVDIPDGSVQWRLVGRTNYRGVLFDGRVQYCWLDQCDITGPYLTAVDFADTTSTGSFPHTCWINNCTINGVLQNGTGVLVSSSSRDIFIQGCTFLPFSNLTGTTMVSFAGQGHRVISCEGYGYGTGVSISGQRCGVVGSTITGCSTGIVVTSGGTHNRVVGNELGTRTVGGANTTGVLLQSGSQSCLVVGNIISIVTDNGTANVVANNI